MLSRDAHILWWQLVPVHPLWHVQRPPTQFPFTQLARQATLKSGCKIVLNTGFKENPIVQSYLAHTLNLQFHQGTNIDQEHNSGHHLDMEGHKQLHRELHTIHIIHKVVIVVQCVRIVPCSQRCPCHCCVQLHCCGATHVPPFWQLGEQVAALVRIKNDVCIASLPEFYQCTPTRCLHPHPTCLDFHNYITHTSFQY